MEIYCICMFYLNEQTINYVVFLKGIHIKCTRSYIANKYTEQNMLIIFKRSPRPILVIFFFHFKM